MSRYMAAFRYRQWCLQPDLESVFLHVRITDPVFVKWIYCGTALLYFFGFGLMCLMIKEGQYPPRKR